MTVQNFVYELSKIPSKERVKQLSGMGLEKDFIEEYISSYFFIQKSVSFKYKEDALISLVENYQGSSVKIGMITFNIEPYEDDKYYYFGRFEIDPLIINKKTKEILLVDYEENNHVIFYCAKDSYCFLEAILEAARFIEKLPFDSALEKDQAKICYMSNYCSSLAGGKKYLDFYKTLIGCDN